MLLSDTRSKYAPLQQKKKKAQIQSTFRLTKSNKWNNITRIQSGRDRI